MKSLPLLPLLLMRLSFSTGTPTTQGTSTQHPIQLGAMEELPTEQLMELLPDRFRLDQPGNSHYRRTLIDRLIAMGVQPESFAAATATAHLSQCPIQFPPFPDCSGTTRPTKDSVDNTTNGRPRLSDIRLIAAMGDSVTCGMFMRGTRSTLITHLLGGKTEDRSRVFSVGGATGALTIATNLQQFVGNLTGKALTDTKSGTQSRELPLLQLDLAVISTPVEELISQAEELVRRLTGSEFAEYRQHWKMINIFGGAINLCRSCLPEWQQRTTVDAVGQSLDYLLKYLHSNIPRSDDGSLRVLINVFTMFERPSSIYELFSKDPWCRRIQKAGDICSCLYQSDAERQRLDRLTTEYNRRLVETIGRWQQSPQAIGQQFLVSAVRSMEQMDFKTLGAPYISPTDCFHPNECFNRLIAYHGWQMITLGINSTQPLSSTTQWDTCDRYANTILEMHI